MAQFARPTSDVATGSWVTAPLWSKVDETVASDTDSINDNGVGGTAILGLSSVNDPFSSTGHILRVRAKEDSSGDTLQVQLRQGATTIATFSQVLGTAFTTYTFNLSGAQADSITDYTTLRVALTLITGGFGAIGTVSWIEFEVPDSTKNATGSFSISEGDNIALTTQKNAFGVSNVSERDTVTLTAGKLASRSIALFESDRISLAGGHVGVAALAISEADRIALSATKAAFSAPVVKESDRLAIQGTKTALGSFRVPESDRITLVSGSGSAIAISEGDRITITGVAKRQVSILVTETERVTMFGGKIIGGTMRVLDRTNVRFVTLYNKDPQPSPVEPAHRYYIATAFRRIVR